MDVKISKHSPKLLQKQIIYLAILPLMLTNCSDQKNIANGYVIYDLDGSNRIIINKSGLVSIPKVIRYATSKRFIFIEANKTFQRKNDYYLSCERISVEMLSNKVYKISSKSSADQVISKYIDEYGKSTSELKCL